MGVYRCNDLRAFCDFADLLLSTGESSLTLDEALIRWELANSSEKEREQTLREIRLELNDMDESLRWLRLRLDDMNAGRTVDFFEFVDEWRRNFASADE